MVGWLLRGWLWLGWLEVRFGVAGWWRAELLLRKGARLGRWG